MDTLFRTRGDFEATIDAAAGLLTMDPAIVEKDYWVSQALRRIAASFPEDFVFKGGTSLSKGFGLIQRFSEDIDVLVIPGTRGRAARDTLMKSMGDDAAQAIGDPEPGRDGGGGFHRSYYLTYPRKREVSWLRPTIDLDMGIRGGPNPSERRRLEPLLRSALQKNGVESDTYLDLVPFELNVLHPGRTVVEKLALVNEEAEKCERDPAIVFPPPLGRHFYDIYMLLGSQSVATFLEDRERFAEVVQDCERVSREYFKSDYVRPEDGYGKGPAFQASDRVKTQLQSAVDNAQDLYFGTDPYPTWVTVVDRVRTVAELL